MCSSDSRQGQSHDKAHTVSAIDISCTIIAYSSVIFLGAVVMSTLFTETALACPEVLGT